MKWAQLMLQVIKAETKTDTVQFLRDVTGEFFLFCFLSFFTAALKFNAQGGNPDFKWQGWSNGGENGNPKKSLGFQNNKNPWTKN